MESLSRPIARLVTPQPVVEGAGVRLRRSIATRALDYVDPFLLLDHFGSDNPADYLAGFPMHPHRGIETVTYMLAGQVDHQDSMGNAGTIGAGDVQWMTAGRAILHQEMPRPVDGRMAGFQLWVNLPAAQKMTAPRYQEISAKRIPIVRRSDGTVVRVIAGAADGVPGPVAEIVAEPTYLDVSVPSGGAFLHSIPRGHTALAYAFEGEGRFGPPEPPVGLGRLVRGPQLVVFGDGDCVEAAAAEPGLRFLLISGRPLYEPIARYGPFVMNTWDEIEKTLEELRNGTFV